MKERTKGYEDYRGTTGLLKGYRSSSAVAESVRWTGPREYSSSAAETDSPLVSAKSSVLAVEGTCAVCCVLFVCLYFRLFVCLFVLAAVVSILKPNYKIPKIATVAKTTPVRFFLFRARRFDLFQGAPKGTQGILKGC